MLHVVPFDSVSKYDLLRRLAAAYSREDIRIEQVAAETPVDRRLLTMWPGLNQEVWSAAGYDAPRMVREMVEEQAAVVREQVQP